MAAAKTDLSRLLSLLDDEDESIAVQAMAELLFREDELCDELGELQESSNPLLRRRAHQLQAALTLRRRRREFFGKLNARQVDFIDGLIDVHLQWYDNDSRPELEEIWEKFRAEVLRRPPDGLESIAFFMRKHGFTAEADSTLRPEFYCIGPVIENRQGSAALLAGIAAMLLPGLRVVRILGDFALYDGSGTLLVPAHDWQLTAAPEIDRCEFWDFRMLLKFASTMLFSCAVTSDSFRYVLTIAQALSGTEDDEALDYFPYPYFPADDPPEEESGSESSRNVTK